MRPEWPSTLLASSSERPSHSKMESLLASKGECQRYRGSPTRKKQQVSLTVRTRTRRSLKGLIRYDGGTLGTTDQLTIKTARTLAARSAIVNGLGRKATPGSTTPLWTTALRVPGRVKHPQCRRLLPQCIGQLTASHAGHYDVGAAPTRGLYRSTEPRADRITASSPRRRRVSECSASYPTQYQRYRRRLAQQRIGLRETSEQIEGYCCLS
jgi:hypothetical protein